MIEELDEIDVQILNILQENARITNKDLAAQLGLSVTPTFERIKKLEKKGFITKYVALVDHQKLDKSMIIMTSVASKEHNKDKVDKIFDKIKKLPEVMECYHVSGEYDFMLKVVVKNMSEYEDFLLNKLATMENIAHVNSTFVLSTIKHKTAYQITSSEDESKS